MSFYDNSPELVDDIPPAQPHQYSDQESEAPKQSEREEPTAQPAAQPEEESKQDAAPNDGVPEAIRQLRNDPARRMFSADSRYPDVVVAVAPDGADKQVHRLVNATNSEYREILADMDCTNAEAKEFTGMLAKAAQNPPPTPEQKAQQAQMTYAQLHAEYGTKYLEAIGDAMRLAKRDPRVWNLVVTSHLESFPDMVKWLCKKAKSEKSKGRLPRDKGGDK